MSGRRHLDLFTLPPRPGADPWRLPAALALSFLLHVAAIFLPPLGPGSSASLPRGTQKPGAARVLDVRLEPLAGFVAQIAEPPQPAQADSGAGPVGVPVPSAEIGGAVAQPARGLSLAASPAPAYYPAEQLTKQPRPLNPPKVAVPPGIARAVSGIVVLRVWINELGSVDSVEVERTNLPSTIAEPAVEDFKQVRFEPGEIDGRRVKVLLRVELAYGPGRRQAP